MTVGIILAVIAIIIVRLIAGNKKTKTINK